MTSTFDMFPARGQVQLPFFLEIKINQLVNQKVTLNLNFDQVTLNH